MELQVDKCGSAAQQVKQDVQQLSSFYEGMSWEDEVGASFETFVTDMQKTAQQVEAMAQQAQNVAANLEDVDVDALAKELDEICSE